MPWRDPGFVQGEALKSVVLSSQESRPFKNLIQQILQENVSYAQEPVLYSMSFTEALKPVPPAGLGELANRRNPAPCLFLYSP